jgi:hypothetical protein
MTRFLNVSLVKRASRSGFTSPDIARASEKPSGLRLICSHSGGSDIENPSAYDSYNNQPFSRVYMTIPGSGVGVGVGAGFFSCFQYSESEDKGGMGIPPYSR